MPSPFVGMDPYLEHPEVWPGVHLLLIAALADTLAPQLRPKYSVSVEVRMYGVTITLRQGYLEIREIATKQVITAVELLSPVNKRPGQGRQSYENKRSRILGSATHLVEIDLLRAYEPMPLLDRPPETHYRILVSDSTLRPQAQLYGFNVQDKIPPFPLPLQTKDPEQTVDLQQLLSEIYDRSGYDLKLDYQKAPVPAFAGEDARWLDNQLKQNGLR